MDTELPRVGLIVPVWNRAGLVAEALESVRAQTHAPTQVIVVDDGSTDGSADAVAAWLAGRGGALDCELLRRAHEGAGSARNAGLAALGDLPLVAFLDSDDRWPTDFLERTVAALQAAPRAVAASVDRLRLDARDGSRARDDLAALAPDPVTWFFQHGAGVGSCTLLRTDAVRARGGYPEQVATGHDVLLFSAVAQAGPWLHCPGEPVTFLQGHQPGTGQADHVCHFFPDHELIWARAFDTVARSVPAAPRRLARIVRRRALARRWRKAGAAMTRLGRALDARACYARALRLWPWKRATWSGGWC